MIRPEHDDGVLREASIIQRGQQAPHLGIHIADRREVALEALPLE